MATKKKTFIKEGSDNPALAFISEESIQAVEQGEEGEADLKTIPVIREDGEDKESPTVKVLSGATTPRSIVVKHPDGTDMKAPTGEKPPKGYKYNPLYIEVKSKRVQLVFQPSLYERVKAASERAGLSFNEYCHRILDEATKGE